jgi:prophage regulatory protein
MSGEGVFVPDRIVGEHERRNITGLGRTTAWAMEKAGTFPRRVELTGGRVGWRLSDLMRWVAELKPRGTP